MHRDVASGADRHLDITFGLQVVESSSLVSVLFREVFNHVFVDSIVNKYGMVVQSDQVLICNYKNNHNFRTEVDVNVDSSFILFLTKRAFV